MGRATAEGPAPAIWADLRQDRALTSSPRPDGLDTLNRRGRTDWPLPLTAPAAPAAAREGSDARIDTLSVEASGPAPGAASPQGRKASLPPPPPPEPAALLRGAAPWNDERLQNLLDDGAIRAAWLPDIRATAPTHLQIQNEHQREMLRFSNAIANTGANNLQVRRGTPISDPAQIAFAVSLGLDPEHVAITAQELLDETGRVAAVIPDAALSEFHPTHRHFHIGETAEFSIERFKAASNQWDPITGLEVVKTTFCLIDVNQIRPEAGSLDPDHYETIKSPANSNVYNDCFADVQGIQAGWMDRYPHSLPGQEVDISSLSAGIYRIVCRVNPSRWFLESDFTNNIGWTSFELNRDSSGNGRLREIPGATAGIWFDHSSNGQG